MPVHVKNKRYGFRYWEFWLGVLNLIDVLSCTRQMVGLFAAYPVAAKEYVHEPCVPHSTDFAKLPEGLFRPARTPCRKDDIAGKT